MRLRFCAALVAALAGCGPMPVPRAMYTIRTDATRSVASPDVGQAEWTLSRERFARLQKARPERPYVERVRVGIVDPRTGKVFQARGAVAVSPRQAARLVLLGPGGTTALDVWVTPDKFRLSVPSLKIEKRGGADPDDARGLPIGFLRWWFLDPLGGRLLLARSNKTESAFLLRDGDATSMIRTDGARFLAIRRRAERVEGVDWSGHALSPHAGARGRYLDGTWGVRVDVVVEAVLPDEPDPAAFLDPDVEGTSL